MSKDEEVVALRELSKNCLFFFAYFVLGYKDLDKKLHWEMAREWQLNHRHKLFLAPRGTFKTTIWTISGTIFEIINDPDIRILISNATLENAKLILKGIKTHFISNEKFRTLFPEFCPKIQKNQKTIEFGTQLDLSVPNRAPGVKEATVEIGSVEGNLVSRHYDMHIGDDLVNDKNTTTKAQIDKIDFFRQAVYSLLEPGTSRDYLLGTRWHWDDIYGRIIEDKETPYYIYRRQIMEPDKRGRMRSIFPSRFPVKEIKEIRKKQGSAMFSGQYMNEPVDPEDALFKRDWIDYYELPKNEEERKAFLDSLLVITCVDPAVSEAIRADFSAIVTIGIGPDDETYVLEAYRAKINPGDLISKLFSVYAAWRPLKIGIETFSFQQSLKYFIKQEMQARKVPLPIIELQNPGRRSKEARIAALQPRIEHCKFSVLRDMVDLIDELTRFPKAKHDDLIDALAYTEQLRMRPGRRSVPDSLSGQRAKDVFNNHFKKKRQLQRIGGHRLDGTFS